MSAAAAVAEEVRALTRLDLEGLRAEWGRRYGPAPRIRSADLLARLLAWRIQSAVLGGLDAATRDRLLGAARISVHPELTPGVRLEREWRGVREVVVVVENGFRWGETTYRSLSQVAQAITGTKWNGPRFFGLRDRPE